MSTPAEPFADPGTSKEKIYRATYLAFVEHGYADLSIQHIANNTSLSKSTIYHHFENKEALLMSFAKRLLEWYIEQLLFDPTGDPIENLEQSLDLAFLGETEDGVTMDQVRPEGLGCVYIGLRMEAARNPDLRDYFDALDGMSRDRLETLIERGVENGTLRDVDPEPVAAVLLVFLEGALMLRSTENDTAWLRHARAMLDEYLDGLKVE